MHNDFDYESVHWWGDRRPGATDFRNREFGGASTFLNRAAAPCAYLSARVRRTSFSATRPRRLRLPGQTTSRPTSESAASSRDQPCLRPNAPKSAPSSTPASNTSPTPRPSRATAGGSKRAHRVTSLSATTSSTRTPSGACSSTTRAAPLRSSSLPRRTSAAHHAARSLHPALPPDPVTSHP